jgi:hypothetical protein
MRFCKPLLLPFLLAVFAPFAGGEDFKPNLGPDLARITVQCGNLTLLLRQSSQWTPGRIDYCGSPMTTEKSAYGTVFLFPGIGFIGTNHLENEPEDLKSLAFLVDGKAVADPGVMLTGKTFRFLRESRIRSFALKSEIELKNDRLHETATVSTAEAVPLKLVYHFMHAWAPSVSAYIAGKDARPGEMSGGPLPDTEEARRKFFIQEPVDWVAVYEPNSSQFAVSRLLEAPPAGGHSSKIWNVSGTYRKYYLTSFQNQTVPAGFTGTWRMVTAFGKSSPTQWEGAAAKLAAALRQ